MRVSTCGIILSATLGFFAATAPARAAIVPTDQLVAGKSYGEWAAEFWKWVLEIPYDANHPFKDRNGANALRGQSGPLIHLYGGLSGTFRSISIPDDRFLYVEILNLACTTLDQPPFRPATTNEADMRICAESFLETNLYLEIDGVSVPNLEQYHLTSPVFSFVVPPNNIFGAPAETAGLGVGAANGVILQPLSPGSHEIRFYGRYPGFNYTADVVYQITVYARPTLSVRHVPDLGVIQLSWPWSTAGSNFTLQESDSLAPDANWSTASVLSLDVIGAPSDSMAVATVSGQERNRFFRLNRSL